MNEIIAIVNQKGGVGKTTTAINLSSAIALQSKKVLLIDIDPQGNATTGFGINRKNLQYCLYDVIINEKSLEEIILNTMIENLYLIPSTVHLAGAEVELVNILTRENKLKKALELTKDNYDFVFIDCPPSLGLLTINALTASNFLIIPLQCEFYALEGLTQLMETIRLVKENLNRELEIKGLLLTMYDSRTNLSKEVESEIRSHFKEKVFRTVIPRSIRLSEAPSHGLPIMHYAPLSKASLAYITLAKEVLNEEIWTGQGTGSPDSNGERDSSGNSIGENITESIPAENQFF